MLQLLVARGRGYDEIAELLHLPEIVVRRRSHDALTELAGGTHDLTDPHRALLCDYLVGELPASRRAEARTLLADDAAARRFARGAAARLSSLPGAQLPELPPEDEEVAEALDALDARRDRKEELQRSSRTGAWLLVAGIAVAVIAAVITLSILAGGDDESPTANRPTDTSSDTPGTTARTLLLGRLAPPSGGSGRGTVALRVNDKGSVDIAAQITGLPKRERLAGGGFTAWAFWLDGPDSKPLALGFYNDTGGESSTTPGTLSVAQTLNGNGVPGLTEADLDRYTDLIVTMETLKSATDVPTTPGRILLSGELGVANS